jgi:ubiquitin fusion degradation protein 1
MAQAINYSAIAPSSDTAANGAAQSHNFSGVGNRLVTKKGKAAASSGSSTPAPAREGSVAIPGVAGKTTSRNRNDPQPLRLPPGKLFFGYEIKPLRNKDAEAEAESEKKHHFSGEGQTLRKKKDGK